MEPPGSPAPSAKSPASSPTQPGGGIIRRIRMPDAAALPPRPPPVLMGREAELAWCADAFSRRRVVAICGLPGIGKTSLLLSAACDQARRMAGRVAYHAAADRERIRHLLAAPPAR